VRKLIDKGIDYLQEKFPPNRVAVILAAPVSIAAGAASAWVAQHAPGLPGFGPEELTVTFGLGVLAAAGLIHKWVDGWQQDEQRRAHRSIENARLQSEERIAEIEAEAVAKGG
jgi:hypothetical protein